MPARTNESAEEGAEAPAASDGAPAEAAPSPEAPAIPPTA